MVHSLNAINDGSREGWHTIAQYGRVAPLEKHPKPSPQVGDSLTLLLPCVPGQGCSQLLHLPLCHIVPAAKGFCHNRQEGNPLCSALLLGPPDLVGPSSELGFFHFPQSFSVSDVTQYGQQSICMEQSALGFKRFQYQAQTGQKVA